VTSGAHRTIPLEEIEALHEVYSCPLEVLSVHYNLVLAKASFECSKRIVERSAFVKEVGKVCAVCDEVACDWFEDCSFERLRFRKLGGLTPPRTRAFPTVPGAGEAIATAVEGFLIISKERALRRLGRSPKGPFFSPGSMDPLLARAMVNLSRVRPGERFLDPFCGTGVIAQEAWRVGALSFCADLDPSMVYGSRINAQHVGAEAEHVLQDSAQMPFRRSSFSAIATDPPYGRSVLSLGHSAEELLLEFLQEARRVLKAGSWVVFAASTSINAEEMIKRAFLKLNKCHTMRVHRSLARYVCTAYTGR